MITYKTMPVMTATPVLLTRREVSINKVQRLENELLKLPQIDVPLDHHFTESSKEGSGMYARVMHLPAGATFAGRVHKFPQINIISKGEIIAYTDNGTETLKAGDHFVALPGAKRAGYALTDVTWTTIIATDYKDEETIEEHLTVPTYKDYLEVQKWLS